MADDLKISLGLDTSGFKSGVQEAKAEVADSSKQMATSLGTVPEAANSAAEDIKKAMGLDFATPLKEAMTLAKAEIASVPAVASSSATSMIASFQLVGLAIGGAALAVFGLEKGLTALADRATDIARSAALVRATAVEWQGMAAAAAGMGIESSQLVTAFVELNKKLDEARQGSNSANLELGRLGLTVEQINDPTLTTVQLWNLLRERLLDVGTSAKTAAELVKQFGAAGYDVSLAMRESGDSMAAWNALSDEQIAKLQQLGHWWGNLYTAIKNVATQGALGYFGQFIAPPAPPKTGDQAAAAPTATDAELRAIKAGIRAYKEGTQERVNILTAYVELAKAKEGENSQNVERAQEQLVQAQEALDAARERDNKASLKRQEADLDVHLKALENIDHGARQAMAAFDRQLEQEVAQEGKQLLREEDANYRYSQEVQKAAARDRVDTTQQLGQIELQARRDAIQSAEQIGAISAAEAIRQAQDVENQRYQLVSAGFDARLALADGDEIQQNKLRNDQLVAEKQHQLALGQLRQGTIDAQRAPALKMINDLSSQWQRGLVQMIQGQLSFANAIRGAWQSIKVGIVNALAESIVANLKMAAIGAITGRKQILSDAAQSAAGAYKATVGIPFIGPVLAPIAAAGAFAAVSAFGKFTAAQGFDIPAGLNPVTQLHAREMVLPAPLADTVRGMAGGSGGGPQRAVNITIHAVDGASVRRVLLANPEALAAGIQRAHQGGHFAKY